MTELNEEGSMGRKSADYKIGYRKPPIGRPFEKGTSGNPKGRPRKSGKTPEQIVLANRPIRDALLNALREIITVTKYGKPERMTAAQALIQSQVNSGYKGNRLAAFELLRLGQKAEQEDFEQHAELLRAAMAYHKMLCDIFEQCCAEGKPYPADLPPHYAFEIDPTDPKFTLVRSDSPDPNAILAAVIELRDKARALMATAQRSYSDAPDEAERVYWSQRWRDARSEFEILNKKIPGPYQLNFSQQEIAFGEQLANAEANEKSGCEADIRERDRAHEQLVKAAERFPVQRVKGPQIEAWALGLWQRWETTFHKLNSALPVEDQIELADMYKSANADGGQPGEGGT